MRWTEKIIAAIRDTFDTLLFFATMAAKEDFRNYVGQAGVENMSSERRLAILGNGPSLKEQLPRLIAEKAWEHTDIMAVNFFALSEEYKIVRPKFYVISDPQFFRKAGYNERIEKFYNALAEQTSWPMTLYVQYYNPEKFDYRAAIKNNPKIRIVPFHTIVYHGFRSLEFWCYRRGLGSGNFGTVVQNGEFIGILLGYKRIELYGVDHTLLDGLMVDDENRLCRIKSPLRPSRYTTMPPIHPAPTQCIVTWPRQPNYSEVTKFCAITQPSKVFAL